MQPSDETIDAHDRQRQLPSAVFQLLIAKLADRLGPHQPCLDAGAGSGMMTVPLAQNGIAMTALDSSPAMLARLQNRAAGMPNLDIVRADIIAMPFPDHAFGSVMVANVFHLIVAWKQALSEMVRVLNADGILLVNLGGEGDIPDELFQLTNVFFTHLAMPSDQAQPPVGPASAEDFEGAVREHDFQAAEPIAVTYDDELTPEAVVQRLEQNAFARPSGVPGNTVAYAARASRSWALDTLGGLNRSFHRTQRIVYRAYVRTNLKPGSNIGDLAEIPAYEH